MPARTILACLLLLSAVGCEYGYDTSANLIPPPVLTEEKTETPLSQPQASAVETAKDPETAPFDSAISSVAPVSEPLNSMSSTLSTPVTSIPREIKLLVPQANFAPEGPNGPLRVKYDDLDLLMILNMEPVPLDAVEHFPGWLKALDGKRIRIRGFMYPPPRQDGITFFQLARDNDICCFGRDPKVYDMIAVEMAKGTSTSYIANRPFDVVGVFHIDPFIDGDKMYELYRLDEASVITR